MAYLDSKLSLREMSCTLCDLLQLLAALVCGQASSDSTGLFWSEIEREVLLVLVEEAELRSLVGVNDCEDLGDGLSDIVAIDSFQLASSSCWLWDLSASAASLGDR